MDDHGHNNLGDLERIFSMHHQRVYTLCLRMTGNVTEAERLTEEVFVEVFRGLQSLPTEAAFSTWLYRLTVNRVLTHFRECVVTRDQNRKDVELSAVPKESSNGSRGAPGLSHSRAIAKSRLLKARMRLRQLLSRRITHRAIDEVICPDTVLERLM